MRIRIRRMKEGLLLALIIGDKEICVIFLIAIEQNSDWSYNPGQNLLR